MSSVFQPTAKFGSAPDKSQLPRHSALNAMITKPIKKRKKKRDMSITHLDNESSNIFSTSLQGKQMQMLALLILCAGTISNRQEKRGARKRPLSH